MSVFRAALSELGDSPSTKDLTQNAGLATAGAVECLCHLGDAHAANELITHLAKIARPTGVPQPRGSTPAPSETALARAVAGVTTGDRWRRDFSPEARIDRADSVRRALVLYDAAAPWPLIADTEEPTALAASLLRVVADGYALLSHKWPDDNVIDPAPSIEREITDNPLIWQPAFMRWMERHGHTVTPPPEDKHRSIDGLMPWTDSSGQNIAFGVTSIDVLHGFYLYEIACIMAASPTGFTGLQHDYFRAVVVPILRTSVGWMAELGRNRGSQGQVGVAICLHILMQCLFCAVHDRRQGSRGLRRNRDLVIKLLHVSGGTAWLGAQGDGVPQWLTAGQH